MTRDPSDGSVKRTVDRFGCVSEEVTVSSEQFEKIVERAFTSTSGLPEGSTKPQNVKRLDKSRAWIKQYHQEKLHARGNDEHQTDGQPGAEKADY